MSFIIAGYTTLGDYLELQRSLKSPTLQRSTPNFDILDTPPPLVDIPEDYEIAYATPKDGQLIHRQTPKGRPQPSLSDNPLTIGLGPEYPSDQADRAGANLFLDCPDSPFGDKTPDVFDDHNSMFHSKVDQGGSSLSDQWLAQQALTASRHASEKLNDALTPRQSTLAIHSQIIPSNVTANRSDVHLYERQPKQRSNISISSLTSDDATNNLTVSHLKIAPSPPKHNFDARPPSRPTISSLQIDTSSHLPNRQYHNSISPSPALAPFTIDASNRYTPQTLPKLHRHDSPSSATPHDCRQTLPSLEAALTSATDSNGTPFSDTPTVLARLSPNQHSSHYGLSPGLFFQAASMPSLSPPKLSSNPEAWRTHSHNSQNSSNSGVSEHGSGYSSNTFSTPATRPSPPPSSSATSQYPGSDHDSIPDSDSGRGRTDSVDPMDGQSQYIFDGTGHKDALEVLAVKVSNERMK
ncbi:hypothetical protein LTR64_000039 [Lithohypha guttulata]|uniref:uncharacterized protein n=1 Tax=Lithohypha guttulata TaxID=1690604 RepID=UPI002DDF92C5|nr:hypothetical protein LTR51_007401 [Lithohypha guttulata]